MQRTITTIGLLLMGFVFAGSVVRAGQKLAGNGGLTPSAARAAVATDASFTPVAADGIQRVTLGFASGNYSPRVIRLRKGTPAEIVADLTRLRGCFTSFAAPDLDLWTQFTTSKDRIAFTPNREGTFRFSCPMGMGSGTIVVDA